MSSFLLDSGLIIEELRGNVRAGNLITYLEGKGDLASPTIVAFEVFRGCRSERERRAAERVFRYLDVVDLTYSIGVNGAKLMRDWPGVFSSEKAVPDAIIAATAMMFPATLVTLNTRQFSRLRIPGLDLMLIDRGSPAWTPNA